MYVVCFSLAWMQAEKLDVIKAEVVVFHRQCDHADDGGIKTSEMLVNFYHSIKTQKMAIFEFTTLKTLNPVMGISNRKVGWSSLRNDFDKPMTD